MERPWPSFWTAWKEATMSERPVGMDLVARTRKDLPMNSPAYHLLLISFFSATVHLSIAQVPGRPAIPPLACDYPSMRATEHWCRLYVIFLRKVTDADTI